MASNQAPFIARGNGMTIPIGAIDFQGNEGMMVPYGTTLERLSNDIRNGVIRYNTDLDTLEAYTNGEWGLLKTDFTPVDVNDVNIIGTVNKSHIVRNLTIDRTFTLPDSDNIGDELLIICDDTVTATNTLTITHQNAGNTLNGDASDIVMNKPYSMSEFISIEAGPGTTEWVLKAELSTVATVAVDSDAVGVLNSIVFMADLTSGRVFTLPDAETIGDTVKLIVDNTVNATSPVAITHESVGNNANGDSDVIIVNSPYTTIKFFALATGTGTTEWIYSLGSGGMSWEVTESGTVNCAAGTGYLIDGVNYPTSNLSLPANPSIGDTIGFSDYRSVSKTTSLSILRNGNNIESSASNIVLNTNGSSIILTYTGSSVGWKIVYNHEYKDNITKMPLYEHSNTVSANYTVSDGNNAMAAGPLEIDTGITVTIPSNSTFTIV